MRNRIFHWILQSDIAWMPWNVHYFFVEWHKAYSFTYKAVEFINLSINILIIDVTIAHVYKTVEVVWIFFFVFPVCRTFLDETFTVWTSVTLIFRVCLFFMAVVFFFAFMLWHSRSKLHTTFKTLEVLLHLDIYILTASMIIIINNNKLVPYSSHNGETYGVSLCN